MRTSAADDPSVSQSVFTITEKARTRTSFKLCKLGVFWNPQDLLLMMGTEILKIDAEMAEKIEVEVGNPLLKSDRKAGK